MLYAEKYWKHRSRFVEGGFEHYEFRSHSRLRLLYTPHNLMCTNYLEIKLPCAVFIAELCLQLYRVSVSSYDDDGRFLVLELLCCCAMNTVITPILFFFFSSASSYVPAWCLQNDWKNCFKKSQYRHYSVHYFRAWPFLKLSATAFPARFRLIRFALVPVYLCKVSTTWLGITREKDHALGTYNVARTSLIYFCSIDVRNSLEELARVPLTMFATARQHQEQYCHICKALLYCLEPLFKSSLYGKRARHQSSAGSLASYQPCNNNQYL